MKQSYFEPFPLFDNVMRPKLPDGAVVEGFYNAGPMICVQFSVEDKETANWRWGAAMFSDYGNLWGINWWASPPPGWIKP